MDDLGVSIRYACLSQRGLYPNDLFKANQIASWWCPKSCQTIVCCSSFHGMGQMATTVPIA